MILVDASIWIDFFRSGIYREELAMLLQIVNSPPILF
jgi:hypothetical protein